MLDKASNRLSFSLITAALIIGSSLLINTRAQTFLGTSHHPGTMGYVAAATLGFWRVVSILRSGKL
jgi:ubiquinone biosynthesis protein